MKSRALENGFDIYVSKPTKDSGQDAQAQHIDRSITLYVEENIVVALSGIRKKRLQLFLSRHKDDFPLWTLPNGKRLIGLKSAFAYIASAVKDSEEKKLEKQNPRNG